MQSHTDRHIRTMQIYQYIYTHTHALTQTHTHIHIRTMQIYQKHIFEFTIALIETFSSMLYIQTLLWSFKESTIFDKVMTIFMIHIMVDHTGKLLFCYFARYLSFK